MSFRYRLIHATDGRNLGWFVSKRDHWKLGDKIGRSEGHLIVITAIVQPENDAASEPTSSSFRRHTS